MSHRYQGNQQGWSGHRGRGGNYRGHSRGGRGHGGWQHAEQQRTSGEHGERSDGGWNQQNSSGPSQSNQQWHNRGFNSGWGHSQPRHAQEQHPQSQREALRSGGSGNDNHKAPSGDPKMQHQSNQMIHAHGQSGGWQQQPVNTTGGLSSDQTFMQKPFENQQDQMVTSQQSVPPYNQNSAYTPMHGNPGVNTHPRVPHMHGQMPMQQDQSHPGSFMPSGNQPQFAPQVQQQPQPNRTQPFPMDNSSANPMIPPQVFHQPPPSAPSELPHQKAFHPPLLPSQQLASVSRSGTPPVSHGGTPFYPGQVAKADQSSDGVKTQRVADEEWISKFLSQVRLVPTLPLIDGKGTSMPISEGRQAVREYLVLLGKLEKLRDTLISCMDCDADTWQQECDKAKQLKVQLNEAQKKLHSPSFVPGLLERIARTKKKRESIARRKKRQFLASKEEEDRKRRVTERIDAVLAKEQKAIQDAKNEAALQAEADSTLFEVRKKKQDADKTLEMLRALRKLRNVRKEAAAQKGAYTTLESDKNFEEGVSKLEAMMNKARSTYREEEQTLLVMLEEEHEENKERQLEMIRQRQRDNALKAVQRRKEILFGKDELVGPDDPMFPFQQFYSLAENNLPSLVEIRKQWDSFLVSPDDPNGSGIPADWVIPAEPSSKEWASVLQET
ncbi:programmed cell death protein 7-like [Amphiura filiformis]|uniref:programmed cell death protein 7-like n=1 Tax=Amphiura filiformis TaxID=82378 RepID=UPI003B2139E7